MTWNPFNWTAVPFLTLYLSLAAFTFLLSFRLRSTIGPAAQTTHRLSELELAYLSGGPRRVGDAVLLGLMSGNGATVDYKGQWISVSNQAPLARLISRPPPLQLRPHTTRRQFQAAVKPIVERVRERLQGFGYHPSDEQMKTFRLNVLPYIFLLLTFGTIKAFIGAERQHPIGILVVLLVITAIVGVVLARRPKQTRAGSDVLRAYRTEHERAARAPLAHELLLALALSGPVVLLGTEYAPVHAASRNMGSGDGSGGGSCGGGGDGGGGCGGCS